MSDNSFVGSQAFNQISSIQEDVIPNSGSLVLNIPLVNLIGVEQGIALSINLTYLMGTPSRFGLPEGWTFGIPFLVPNQYLQIKGSRYIVDPAWTDSTGYASGLKYENNHGVSFVDNVVSQPLPYGSYSGDYEFTYSDVDGSVYYFDSSGLLRMKADRFKNFIYYSYTLNGFIDYVIDSFGQKTQFNYGVNQVSIVYPDSRTVSINYSSAGVSSVTDVAGDNTTFTYVTQGLFNVISTIVYPTGKTTTLSYNSLSFLNSSGQQLAIPAVSDVVYTDQNGNVKSNVQFAYGNNTGGNSFTGFSGGYSISSDSDGLLDSNNTLYVYDVEVRKLDSSGNIISLENTFYSFAHVPTKIDDYVYEGTVQNGFFEKRLTYDIAADKHNQQPNYLQPKTTELVYVAADSTVYPKSKSEKTYDYFGNATLNSNNAYSAQTAAYELQASEQASYFTNSGSTANNIPDTVTKTDAITGLVVQTVNQLTADFNNVASSSVSFGNGSVQNLSPWKKISCTFDSLGRVLTEQQQWLASVYQGIGSWSKSFSYTYDSTAFSITTTTVNVLGNTSQVVSSTMYGQVLSEVTSSGLVTSYTYDSKGRITSKTLPSGQKTTYAYKVFGTDGENSKKTTDALGYYKKSVYDCLGREVKVVDNGNQAGGSTERTLSEKGYDDLGNIVQEVDLYGCVSTGSYNSLGKPLSSVDPNNNTRLITYDYTQNLTSTTLNGMQFKEVYQDNNGKVVLETSYPNTNNPDSASQYTLKNASSYSGFGKVLTKSCSSTQGTGSTSYYTTAYAYNADLEMVTESFTALDGTTKSVNKVLDLNNTQLSSTTTVTYPDARTYSVQSDVLQYNALGQLTKLTNNLDQTESYSYSQDGLLSSKTQFNGDAVSFAYNPDGQMISETVQSGASSYSIQYAYDAVGRLTSTTDSQSTVSKSYSLDGIVLEVSYSDGNSISYVLDQYSRVVSKTDVANQATTYSYNALSQLKTVVKNYTSALSDTLSFTYSTDLSVNLLLGAPAAVELSGQYLETYSYDALGRKTGFVRALGQSNLLTEVGQYNPIGLLVSSTVSSSSSAQALNYVRTYVYDGLNQLVSDKVVSGTSTILNDSFTYDGNSNVLNKNSSANGAYDYDYNAIDQLVSYSVNGGQKKSQTYDANGRLTKNGEGVVYQYDLANRLTKETSGQNTNQYQYYPTGLLSQRSGARSTSFYYDTTSRLSTLLKTR
ncbi:MAG: RHS repeat protein [Limnobacter sp.]|nr:RHS repeat protein [Limnobacter sp.]